MADFARPQDGFKMAFGGMKVNTAADRLPPGKFALAINVRAYNDQRISTRPGLVQQFVSGQAGSLILDMRAYTRPDPVLGNLPRILLASAGNQDIWLDNGVVVGTLVGNGLAAGIAMIPFRPGATPQPWMYCANGVDYQKFSPPSATNVVTQANVGIAEPQLAPNAYAFQPLVIPFYTSHGSPAITAAGTAGAVSGVSRLSDTAQGNSVPDPDNGALQNSSVPVSTGKIYQRLMALNIATPIFDFYEAIPITLNISSIFYFAGTTGRCIVVPVNLSSAFGSSEASISAQTYLANLRHGSLIKIGTETCFVINVTTGPDGTIAIETFTTGTHTTAETMTGVPAIQFPGILSSGAAITASADSSSVTAGIGTLTAAFAVNPFVSAGSAVQPDDYIHLSVNISDVTALTELKFLIDVDDGSFTKNFYYYTIRAADVAAAITNAVTQLSIAQTVTQRAIIDEEEAIAADNMGVTFSGAQTEAGSGQWTEILIPIRQLTRVGNNDNLSLANAVNWQLLINASNSLTVQISSGYVMGGSQPDVGDVGPGYRYRYRARSKSTGVVSNPSPEMRYSIPARRQSINVQIPSSRYDPQLDTWDIFRYGGSVTSWRYVGSVDGSFGANNFTDNFDDSAVGAGDALDFDNYEPWPIVGNPNNGTVTSIAGTTALVVSTDASILNYLPGTLVQINAQNVYTLYKRPTNVTGTTYLLQFVENAGSATAIPFNIQEPLVANQGLGSMWGPDAAGTIFGVGDVINPGKLYFAKNNMPDSAPDTYNIEITAPSEPLMGGDIVDGLSIVGSSEHWWALYPTPDNPKQRYNPVLQPFTRGLAATFGHCTNGKTLYWWAKDGIYSSDEGSLTDADLSTLFPHDGVPGVNYVYNGVTIFAPSYLNTNAMRLVYANDYLYATYRGSDFNWHCLVYNTRTKAWSYDTIATGQLTSIYYIEQPPPSSGSLVNNWVLFAVGNLGAGNQPSICAQQVGANDTTVAAGIPCTLALPEFDAGDIRAPKQWGDYFLDVVPAAAVLKATPMSLGAPVGLASTIPQGAVRTRLPVTIGGNVVSDFLGLMLTWTDNFSTQTATTNIFAWQPSFTLQPARTIEWQTFGTSYGNDGYMHLRQFALAYVATQSVTITITPYDGQVPAAITVPSTGGQYQKTLFPVPANKGLLYNWKATSAAPFQIFLDDSEFYVGGWGRQGPYVVPKQVAGGPQDAGEV